MLTDRNIADIKSLEIKPCKVFFGHAIIAALSPKYNDQTIADDYFNSGWQPRRLRPADQGSQAARTTGCEKRGCSVTVWSLT